MTVIAIATGFLATNWRDNSATGGIVFPSGVTGAQGRTTRVAVADSCRQLRKAVRYYRAKYLVHWARLKGVGAGQQKRSGTPQSGAAKSCPRYLAISAAGTGLGSSGTDIAGKTPRTLGDESVLGSTAATPTSDGSSSGLRSLDVSVSDSCKQLRKAVRYYRAKYVGWRSKMGAAVLSAPDFSAGESRRAAPCPRYLARLLRSKARAARVEYQRWRVYHYHWWKWLPSKWQRIGACETGYGRRPGQWSWNSGTYQGAFGFYHGSWDAFVPYASRKAGPYPSEAYNATPRQQYEVALAIYRRFGLSGWGCRNA